MRSEKNLHIYGSITSMSPVSKQQGKIGDFVNSSRSNLAGMLLVLDISQRTLGR